jgi:pimeloyl-ACP methyl ester carboxylesterase
LIVPRVTYQVETGKFGTVPLVVDERGDGQPFLLLHPGAGPASMGVFAERLADRAQARVIVPTHPGFALTERPDALSDIAGLAHLYAAFLDELALDDVTVIGNSIGGWIAAELGLLGTPWVSRLVLVDAVGLDVPGHPVTDVSGMAPPEIMQHAFHDPAPFLQDPASLSEADRAALAGNQSALSVYAPVMTDPSLAKRLPELEIPVLVIWGASDGIVDPAVGRAYAEAIPSSKFVLLVDTGHMPQLESPELVLDALLNSGDDAAATA